MRGKQIIEREGGESPMWDKRGTRREYKGKEDRIERQLWECGTNLEHMTADPWRSRVSLVRNYEIPCIRDCSLVSVPQLHVALRLLVCSPDG